MTLPVQERGQNLKQLLKFNSTDWIVSYAPNQLMSSLDFLIVGFEWRPIPWIAMAKANHLELLTRASGRYRQNVRVNVGYEYSAELLLSASNQSERKGMIFWWFSTYFANSWSNRQSSRPQGDSNALRDYDYPWISPCWCSTLTILTAFRAQYCAPFAYPSRICA